jgi:ATP-dependent Clp protease ATP-binding subunit ClpC
VLFFARQEAGDMRASSIESEHLLLGLLRENKELLGPDVADEICREFRGNADPPPSPFDNTDLYSTDMPLSEESQRALELAAEEATKLKHEVIEPAHLTLGLIDCEKCRAAEALKIQGFDAVKFRNQLVPPNPTDFEGRNYV